MLSFRVKHQHSFIRPQLVGFSRCGGKQGEAAGNHTIVNNAKPNRKFAAMNLIAFSKGVYLLYYILNKISQ